eukprot:1140238-Pleurochrysis_carterae.AAC.1
MATCGCMTMVCCGKSGRKGRWQRRRWRRRSATEEVEALAEANVRHIDSISGDGERQCSQE